MKRKDFVIITLCIIAISITGCKDDDISLEPTKLWIGNININPTNLKDIDSLKMFYEGNYNEISGDVRIVNVDSYGIDLIGKLKNLQKVHGDFKFLYGDSRVNFVGLENLQEIGGDLLIENCPSLINLEGLQNLRKADKIQLNSNPKLSSLKGLNGVTEIGEGGFWVKDCPIQNFQGLDKLKKVSGWFDVDGASIKSLIGMPLLEELSVVYILHTSIKNLEGFENIKLIESVLGLQYNNSLINLVGLRNPKIQSYDLIFNNSLTSLQGIENVSPTGEVGSSGGMNEFTNNPLLSDYSALSDAYIKVISYRFWSCSGNAYNPTMDDLVAGKKKP